MQTDIHSTSSKARWSWIHRIGLPVMVLMTAVASAIFSLLTLGAHPSSTAGPTLRVDTLSLQREVEERDEAAFAASWAADRAPVQGDTLSPKVIKVMAGFGCGADCLISTWPDGTAVTSNLTSLMDFAALCACPILMQPR
jgi:hypothetical protein